MNNIGSILQNKTYKNSNKVIFLENTTKIINMAEFDKRYMPKYNALAREYGADFLENVAIYCLANANNVVALFSKMLSSGEKLKLTIDNFKHKVEAVKEIIKKLPTVYSGFIYKTYNKIGNHINNILAQCSDTKNISATFIWKCTDYIEKHLTYSTAL